MPDCNVCSLREVQPEHFETENHKKNSSLKEFAATKQQYLSNKKGVAAVSCSVVTSLGEEINNENGQIKISAKPNEKVEFKFALCNESQTDDINVTQIKLVHKRFNFKIQNNPISAECKKLRLAPRKCGNKLLEEIIISFNSPNIGQYESAVMFYFQKKEDEESIILMKEMVVFVEANQTMHDTIDSPYDKKGVWAKELLKSSAVDRSDNLFCIPKSCKHIYARSLKVPDNATQADKDLAADIRQIFNIGVTKENYIKFFHNILWYEETVIRINIKNYNMSGVKIQLQHHMSGTCYSLVVPGLAEKRPSLMIGDLLYIKPSNQNQVMFEAVVKETNENVALIGGLDTKFSKYYTLGAQFDVRFFMSRIPLERMHNAVNIVKVQGHEPRIFPEENKNVKPIEKIINFFNPQVEANVEQRCAVEHIVSGTSGKAPYLLHGPPGTGKTVTIVEAILQLVHKNPNNRIMVCTDSNMAADHVATMIIKYSHMFSKENWLLRSNSKFRTWETIPECLAKYSNGTSRSSYHYVPVEDFMSHSIVITTLSHAAMFAKNMRHLSYPHHITHLFIDEAAQASEPACLIPVCGMLRPNGALVLAGDPHQLGPVVISRNAHNLGLGTSLMERLKKTCPLYSDARSDPNYIVMLRNNFRSNPDILEIPDKLFYKGQLRALAKEDEISCIDILENNHKSRAIVFHGVLSKEQKIGKSPSFFNMMECELVKQYVKNLVTMHDVPMQDIGIVTPYIRQVYQIKNALRELNYHHIEVGTVEAFQGKEKRVIIISTVRANCNLLDHDAKFQLGFLIDDKRFNVAITRAKAKCIIVGNPLCLEKDTKWRMYMQRCRELGTYHGYDYLTEGHDTYRQEIVENLSPMLRGLTITVKPARAKKTVAEIVAECPAPVAVG
ncbi:hypothetical protein PYW08_007528 [Mythimna loreyi]|uniref:Uncharacterized protein n=1 Tax=Mythimna loreyi TaxID=667449 RepID=A0ACC2QDW6_9NEOP|nr:hypothetical protein PYW08_007528 [Mythimna loreyi]